LLGALLVFTTLVNAIGLSSRNQALGLPEGSVRALLALALLGLFAILVSSVLNLKPERRTYSGLREGDVTALIQHNPDARDIVQRQEGDSQPPTFQVEFYSAQRQDDFAKHRRPNCSEGRRPLFARSPHGHKQYARTTDATGREPPVPRSYGRYIVALYNAVRPRHATCGATESPRCKPSLTRSRSQRRNSWQPDHGQTLATARTANTVRQIKS
jgi:hypothetical protein